MALDTTWVDGLVGYKIRRASHAVATGYAPDDSQPLRPVHIMILELIASNRGVTSSTIGAVLGIQRPNMASLVGELDELGLVARRPSEQDRRAVALGLTRAGRGALASGKRAIERHESRLTSNLTDDEAAQLRGLLERITADPTP